MPIKYHFNNNLKTINITCIGELTIHEIMQYFKDIYADDSIELGAVEMVDLSQVSFFNVNYEEAPQMPESYMPSHEKKKIKATFLFGMSKTNIGLSELIKIHFKKNMPKHDFRIFPTKIDAMEEVYKLTKS